MHKRGYVKSPHGKVYKDYGGDLTIILSFSGKNDTLSYMVLVYCHPEDVSKELGIHIRKGSVITKYNLSTHSLLTNLKNLKNKELSKIVKKDLEPLWTFETSES